MPESFFVKYGVCIGTRRLKAGIAEPEWTYISRQLLGKQVTAATNEQATIEVLLSNNDGKCVSFGSDPRLYFHLFGVCLTKNNGFWI
jgi:hypothetical protein